MLRILKGVVLIVGVIVITLIIDNYIKSNVEDKKLTIVKEFTDYLNDKKTQYTTINTNEVDLLVENNFIEYYDIETKFNEYYVNVDNEDIDSFLQNEETSAPDESTIHMYDMVEGEWILKEEYRENNSEIAEQEEFEPYGQDLELTKIDGKNHVKLDEVEFENGMAFINLKGATLNLTEDETPIQNKKFKEAQRLKFVLDGYSTIETGETKELKARYKSLNDVVVVYTVKFKENILGKMTILEKVVEISNEK